MPKITAELNPARYYFVGENWKFTGRIRYKKYSKRVDVEFEISYTEKVYLGYFKGHKDITRFDWLTERQFYLYEIPDIEIVNCS